MAKAKQSTVPRTTRPQKSKAAARHMPLPGYLAFTKEVTFCLRRNKDVFLRVIVLLTVVMLLVTGPSQQSAYTNLIQSTETLSEGGALPSFLRVVVLLVSILSGGLANSLSESQQLYVGFAYLMAWLVIVWLLRQRTAGHSVNFRDGLYNAGGPLIPTLLVGLFAIVQILPLALVATLFSALSTAAVLNGWLVALVTLVLLGLTALTIFWLMGTVFAAVVVTIPGAYPVAALKSARELVKGYRLHLVKRILWLILVGTVVYITVMLPLLLLDVLVGHALSFIVPTVVIALTATIFSFEAAYIYLLYRGVIDQRAK